MSFIKKISLNFDGSYQSSDTILMVRGSINDAIHALHKTAKEFVATELGREAGEKAEIIDIKTLDQVNCPQIDSILLYRTEEDKNIIHVYQKKSIVTTKPGWLYGQSEVIETTFGKICLFELELSENNMHPKQPVDNIRLPTTTSTPLVNHNVELFNELQQHRLFIARRELDNN